MGTKPTAKVALITGAAKRIGAALARSLHQSGFNILIHYGSSKKEAVALQAELESLRPNSALCLCANLSQLSELTQLGQKALCAWGRIDVLINNASRFYPTELDHFTLSQWDELINTNLRAPLFLSQALAKTLKQHHGCIINLVDIYAERPLKNHPIYSISKAGLGMLTKSLALELGPDVRVNGIAPGAILWPENVSGLSQTDQQTLLQRTALKHQGDPEDICKATLFLINQAPYMTGQILNLDGGRTLNQ
ncbi:MAG: pteridine reductase [Pseudomonadales bacterium]|nr:pteridine reductase [Pseudomonadales bacterium]